MAGCKSIAMAECKPIAMAECKPIAMAGCKPMPECKPMAELGTGAHARGMDGIVRASSSSHVRGHEQGWGT